MHASLFLAHIIAGQVLRGWVTFWGNYYDRLWERGRRVNCGSNKPTCDMLGSLAGCESSGAITFMYAPSQTERPFACKWPGLVMTWCPWCPGGGGVVHPICSHPPRSLVVGAG
jgi:hypothetical protein